MAFSESKTGSRNTTTHKYTPQTDGSEAGESELKGSRRGEWGTANNAITLQKHVTFTIVEGNIGHDTAYYSYPTLPSTKSAFRMFGSFWTFKYFYEQSSQNGNKKIESDACQICLYLVNTTGDIEFQLFCDSGQKANLGGWSLSQVPWISIKVSFVNPETKQLVTIKKANGGTRCGKLLCQCRQSKLCFRKQAFCSPDCLQPFLVINKCAKPRYGMAASFYCSLDAFVTVSLLPQSPNSTNRTSLDVHDLYWKSQHEASKRIFHAKIGTDFKIETKGQDFPCHKCILAGHSEVFSRMFTNENKRRPSTKLAMESMSVVGVESFLKYLYYGDTTFSQLPAHVAFELMTAAEKYSIPHLRKLSFEILGQKSSSDLDCATAVQLFRFASQKSQYLSLKKVALQCFIMKYVELVKSEEFVKLFEENREMAQEILIKVHNSS